MVRSDMVRSDDVIERIRGRLEAGGIEPTPANYEFWYRYVTEADPVLRDAVDARMGDGGQISAEAMEQLRREYYGQSSPSPDFVTLLSDTQVQLTRMAEFVERADGDMRDYSRALRTGKSNIEEAGASAEAQRHLFSDLAAATAAMIENAEALEKRLTQSGEEIGALRRDLELAQSESRTDALTSLPNRKAFQSYLEAQAARALANRRPLSIAFCDIDHFKAFNDSWGHRIGDEVLRLVGQSLEKLCHGIGYPARYGGEEFVIVMPDSPIEAAHGIAEQIRDFIASRSVRAKGANTKVGRITLSLGLAQLRWSDSLEELIERADAALYLAKERGRNRVCLETEVSEAGA